MYILFFLYLVLSSLLLLKKNFSALKHSSFSLSLLLASLYFGSTPKMKRDRNSGQNCLACTRGTCMQCEPERVEKRQKTNNNNNNNPTINPRYDIDPALCFSSPASSALLLPLPSPSLPVSATGSYVSSNTTATTTTFPAPMLPDQVAIHFFPSHDDHALVAHLIGKQYDVLPEMAEAENVDEGICWEGTLAALCLFVEAHFSPLVALVRRALKNDGRITHEGATISRWDHTNQCLHIWYRVSLAQDGNSMRAIQAIVTLLNGAGDLARDCLLGEELVNAIRFAHSLAILPRALIVPPTDEDVRRLFLA